MEVTISAVVQFMHFRMARAWQDRDEKSIIVSVPHLAQSVS
jgi:hypothetical protein